MPFPTPSLDVLERLAGEMALSLGFQPPPEAPSRVAAWLHLLHTWNQRIDLTAARSLDELLDLCLADACLLARHVPDGASVVDVGSGAGAPGLPLALLRPDLHLTLVEPAAKRVSFLRTVIGSLHLDAAVIRERVERLTPATPWQVAVSRATLEPSQWLAAAADLVAGPQARIAVLLARQPSPTHPSADLVEEVDYAWPRTGVARRLCLYRLVSAS